MSDTDHQKPLMELVQELEYIAKTPPLAIYRIIDLKEAARQLRLMATMVRDFDLMKEQCKVSDEAFNFHLKRANELMDKCATMEARIKELELDLENKSCDEFWHNAMKQTGWLSPNQVTTYNQKIQDWWWRLFGVTLTSADSLKPHGKIQADMESFMREHGIKLEKPSGGAK